MSGYQHLAGAAVAGGDALLFLKRLHEGVSVLPSVLTERIMSLAQLFFPGNFFTGILCGILYFLGSIFPDTDSPHSLVGRHIRISGGGHRKWMHTAYVPMLCLLFGFRSPYILWFGLGYLVHLFLDAPSKCGVCFFNPVTGYREYPGGAKIKKNHFFVLYRSEAGAVCLLVLFYLLSVFYLWQNRMLLFG